MKFFNGLREGFHCSCFFFRADIKFNPYYTLCWWQRNFWRNVKLRENFILQVSEWLIGGCGLLYDREWVILSEHRACLSQKQEPRLSLVLPFLTPHSQHLELRFQGLHTFIVMMSFQFWENTIECGRVRNFQEGRIFSDKFRSFKAVHTSRGDYFVWWTIGHNVSFKNNSPPPRTCFPQLNAPNQC